MDRVKTNLVKVKVIVPQMGGDGRYRDWPEAGMVNPTEIESSVNEHHAQYGLCQSLIMRTGQKLLVQGGPEQFFESDTTEYMVADGSMSVREYLDRSIKVWRKQKRDYLQMGDTAGAALAAHYVDAYQSARASIIGSTLSREDE